MSDKDKNVILIDQEDQEIQLANQRARATFKYFWREIHWDRRRIVKALDMAAVKVAFADIHAAANNPGTPSVEHMWIGDVDFDGRLITGTLMNSPKWLKTVKAGDQTTVPLNEIDDWMYVALNRAYGGFTVNLTRSRMSPRERKQHDDAWGLDFGSPSEVRLVCFGENSANKKKSKGLFGLFGGKPDQSPINEEANDPDNEHPASIAIVPMMKQAMAQNPAQLVEVDERGWTALHHEALAGSAPTVAGLLELGANPSMRNKDGLTPLDLAKALGWTKVEALLRDRSPDMSL